MFREIVAEIRYENIIAKRIVITSLKQRQKIYYIARIAKGQLAKENCS